MRPEFSIVEWRSLDALCTQPAVAQTQAKPSVGKPVSPEEDMDDAISF
jgi:hypothetical protein